jgi:hypothetical protein
MIRRDRMVWLLIKEGEWTSNLQKYCSESEVYKAYEEAKEGTNDWVTMHITEVKESLRYVDVIKQK